MMLEVQFRSTEAGLRLLRSTLRTYLRSARVPALTPGRIRRSELGTTDPRELSAQSSFLRLVGVVEATVDSLGTELTSKRISISDEAIRLLMLEKELAATSSWEGRHRSFRRHHKLKLASCAEHGRVEGAIEVRNAVAHGLGKLTTRQLVSADTKKRLDRIDVQVVNKFVALEPRHVRECAEYGAVFLRSIDERLV